MDHGYFQIKVIKELGEFAPLNGEFKGLTVRTRSTITEDVTCEFLIYSLDSCRFYYWETILKTDSDSGFTCINKKWSSFTLFNSIIDLVPSHKSLWVINKNYIQTVDFHFIQDPQKSNCNNAEDSMDIDDEFQKRRHELLTSIPNPKNLIKEIGSVCSTCQFIDGGILLCHKSEFQNKWCLQAIKPNKNGVNYDEKNIVYIGEISTKPDVLEKDELGFLKPALLCISVKSSASDAQQSCMSKTTLSKLFGLNPLTSFHCVCLTGLPDGRIVWHTLSKQYSVIKSCNEQVLYNIGQPVRGLDVSQILQTQEKNDCILIVGSMGKLCFISKEAQFQSSVEIKTSVSSFWISTVYIPSPIYTHIVINNSIIYTSSGGQLWITAFRDDKKEEMSNLQILDPLSESTEFSGIKSVSLISTSEELLSVLTTNGNLYICKLVKKEKFMESSMRMPSLMNDCFQISLQLQKLEYVKTLQTRLFTAISTFASLKFSDKTEKEHATCSITEIFTQPKKYLLDICFTSLETLNLDPELWYLCASVHSYFQNQATALSKTGSLKKGGSHLCLEVPEEIFQSSSSSIFPLSLETGLILNLPKAWKHIESFKLLLKKLPMYLRLQTIVLHELLLVKNRPVSKYNLLQKDYRNVLSMIQNLNERKPMYRLLDTSFRVPQYELLVEFTFSISVSNVENMLKDTSDNLAESFLGHILRKSQLKSFANEMNLSCRNHAISLSANQNQNNVIVKISADSLNVLAGLRIGVIETLLNSKKTREPNFVSIPASINRKCETISATITNMFSENMDSTEFRDEILRIYKMLRKDVSNKLPFF